MLLLAGFFASAQQDAQYTQYMYNTISVNPAYAGSRDVLSVVGLYRSQWVGLDGAPETQTLSIHAPVGNKVGLGLSIVNDEIGPSNETYIDVDFSYTLNVGATAKLALGIKAGANLLSVDYNKLTGDEDVIFQDNIDNRFMPNVGIGAYWYDDKYYLGFSSPDLLETEHYDDDEVAESYLAKERLHAYLMGGYVFDLDYNLKFKPAFLVKAVDGAPLQVDISVNFLINERFTLGAAYRWSAAVSGLAGFQISDQLMIGYAYDQETTELRKYNSGSHEIVLRFELFKNVGNTISPRFF